MIMFLWYNKRRNLKFSFLKPIVAERRTSMFKIKTIWYATDERTEKEATKRAKQNARKVIRKIKKFSRDSKKYKQITRINVNHFERDSVKYSRVTGSNQVEIYIGPSVGTELEKMLKMNGYASTDEGKTFLMF